MSTKTNPPTYSTNQHPFNILPQTPYDETCKFSRSNNRDIRKIFSVAHLSYEIIRRATFDSWPVSYISKDELAKAGFFYMRKSDLVQCFFCKGIVGYWETGDRPLREHQKHFPNCPFVLGSHTSNVPLSFCMKDDSSLHGLLNKHLIRSLECSKPVQLYSRIQTDSVDSKEEKRMAYPAYSTEERRLYSLTNWPEKNTPSKEKLAEAGFFYTGLADFVMCFYCGGGLFNWSEDDDPSIDHRLYYSHCPYLGLKQECVKPSSELVSISQAEEELLLQYSISENLLGMGLSPHSIKGALKEHLETYSYLPGTFMDCTDVVVEWEDKQRYKLKEMEIDDTNQVSNVHNNELTTMNEISPVKTEKNGNEGLL